MGIWNRIKNIIGAATENGENESGDLFDGLISRDKAPGTKPSSASPFDAMSSGETAPTIKRETKSQQRRRARSPRFKKAKVRVELLKRNGLPVWSSPLQVAEALRINPVRFLHLTRFNQRTRHPRYRLFTISKRSGGQRTIMAPLSNLKFTQRKLNESLVSKLPVSDYAHGFRKGRSIRSAAQPHVGKKVVVTMDLAGFFDSVTFSRVRGLLISVGYPDAVAAPLASLMTEAPRTAKQTSRGRTFYEATGPRTCVQGAPTSPGLCNAVARHMDMRLAGLARRLDMTYTRYADDLTFSGDNPATVGFLIHVARQIIQEEGFQVNESKTRVARQSSHQRVVGVTVNQDLGLSRKQRRRIRAALHRARINGASVEEHAKLQGMLAYVHMLNEQQAAKLSSS